MHSLFPLIVTGGLALSSAAFARCPRPALEEGWQTIRSMRPELQPGAAAQVLARACTWPAGVQSAIQGLSTTPADKLNAVDRQMAATAPDLWTAACPGGLDTVANAVTLGPVAGHSLVHEACAVEALGVATRDEYAMAHGSMLLPVVVAWTLHSEGHNPDLVRDYARAIAGLSVTPLPPPPAEPAP